MDDVRLSWRELASSKVRRELWLAAARRGVVWPRAPGAPPDAGSVRAQRGDRKRSRTRRDRLFYGPGSPE